MTEATRLLGGRYEVGELIGRGGMAEVHLGYDTRLSRQVAIKMLRTDLARDATFLTRFRREAHSSAKLNHSAIVAVYDSGEERTVESGGGELALPYIVMEFVDGRTLREVLRDQGTLPPAEAARITEGVLSALAYSHRMGIVHRDIKPANVMLGSQGEVKVMDFGIARAIADSNATMTQTQAVIGTAQYLSPEQAQGQAVDARSDLYSAGCMLFELLTGKPPFQGDSPVAIAYQHVGEPPTPPSELEPDVPPAYDAVVIHALVKDREGRYQNADDFRTDLQHARLGREVSAAARASLAALSSVEVTRTIGSVDRTYAASASPSDAPPEPPAADSGTSTIPAVTSEERRRRRGAAYIALGVALLAALTLLGFGLKTYIDNQEREANLRTVPMVVNDSQSVAEKKIRDVELTPRVQTATSDRVAEGDVLRQSPEANTRLDKGSVVTITVSTGKASIQVPPLAGNTVERATELLQELDLTVGKVERVNDNAAPKDTVIESVPGEGSTVPRGSPVTLRVSTGKVTVPTVTRTTQNAALKTLAEAGLVGQVETRQTDAAAPGTVIAQDPAKGLVDRGTTVKLTGAAAKPSPPPAPSPSTPSPSATPSPSETPTESPTPSESPSP